MATQILKMSTSAKTVTGVRNKLNYVENGATKDENGNVNCYGHNCLNTAKKSFESFKENRNFYGTNHGRLLSEEIISIQGSLDQEKRLEIVQKYLDEFYPNNQVFYGEHVKDRITADGQEKIFHYHLEIDTTDFVTGKKIHQTKLELEEKKAKFYEICREYGLEIHGKSISPKSGPASKKTYETQKRGKATDKDRLVDTYKTVIKSATSKDDFIKKFNENGYSVEWGDKKNIVFTVKAEILQGKKDKFRLNTIQKDYGMEVLTKDDLIKKIDENKKNAEKTAGKITINVRKQKTKTENTIKIKATKSQFYKKKEKDKGNEYE